jgi:hypothetical protein
MCKKGTYLFSFLHFALALRSVDIPSKTVEKLRTDFISELKQMDANQFSDLIS